MQFNKSPELNMPKPCKEHKKKIYFNASACIYEVHKREFIIFISWLHKATIDKMSKIFHGGIIKVAKVNLYMKVWGHESCKKLATIEFLKLDNYGDENMVKCDCVTAANLQL